MPKIFNSLGETNHAWIATTTTNTKSSRNYAHTVCRSAVLKIRKHEEIGNSNIYKTKSTIFTSKSYLQSGK